MKIIITEAQLVGIRTNILLEKLNLSSFEMQDQLNPDIFDENDKMIPVVRKKLLQIGKDFYEFLGTDWVDLVDIILTGSLANYNWSKFSDVDLHIVIPFNQISKNKELVEELTWAKKELWNTEHDIKIKDYEVELYAQDTEDDLVAGGVYSVLHDKWLRHPERQDVNLDKSAIGKLVDEFEGRIDKLLKKMIAGDCYGITGDIDDLKADISDMRKRGLATGGEFSPENIAFKSLRRTGALDKLDAMKNELYDGSMSVEKSRKEKADSGELKKTKRPEQEKEKPSDDDAGDKGGQWMIQGRRFSSLRKAEKVLGIPKSTIEARVKSDSPEFSGYKKVGY